MNVYESVSKSFRTESIMNYMIMTINIHWEATQGVMEAKLTRVTHKISIQLHLVAESCTICNLHSRQPVQKLPDTPPYSHWPNRKCYWEYSYIYWNEEIAYLLWQSYEYVGAGIAQWYSARLWAGWSGVWVLARVGNFSLHCHIQTGSGSHPTSCPMVTRGSLPGGKAAGVWSWPLTSS
jgi:hypothetical protein